MSRLPASSDRAAATPTFKDGLGTRVRVADAGGDPVEHLELVPELANQESRSGIASAASSTSATPATSACAASIAPRPASSRSSSPTTRSTATACRPSSSRVAKLPLTVECDVALQIVRDLLPAIGILHDSRKVTHGCHRAGAPGLHLAAAAGDRRSRPRRRADAAEPPPQEAVGAVPHRLAGDEPRRLRREDGRRPDWAGRARPAARPSARRRRVPGPGQAPDLQHQGDLVAHRLAADRPRAAPLARARHRRRRGADVQLDQGSAGRLRGRRRRRSLFADRGRAEGVLPPLRRADRRGRSRPPTRRRERADRRNPPSTSTRRCPRCRCR